MLHFQSVRYNKVGSQDITPLAGYSRAILAVAQQSLRRALGLSLRSRSRQESLYLQCRLRTVGQNTYRHKPFNMLSCGVIQFNCRQFDPNA